uniref:Uncharacterized protein n=1 Tax=Anguilla anguilla TaxID=7936 RepID=A0A0E9RCB3_ANGAN
MKSLLMNMYFNRYIFLCNIKCKYLTTVLHFDEFF